MAGLVPVTHVFAWLSTASRGWPGQARPWRGGNDRGTYPLI